MGCEMPGVPYFRTDQATGQVTFNRSWSRSETVEFTFENWEYVDGTEFPWDEYEIQYIVEDGPELTQDDGIHVNEADRQVTFSVGAPGEFEIGNYKHECRLYHPETEKYVQVFSGILSITEGPFEP